MTRHLLALLLLPALLAADAKPKGKPNRLVKSSSPYLLQHAHNPVDWHPWGEEAFQLAKKENKLVFLSIGYSSCHWCHVMEKESFANDEVAKFLNKHFVCIKVDREERPDVDQIYMASVQMMAGHGGWPMSVFLTPDLRPFTGGTYFPPDDRYGRPGFLRVLHMIAEAWRARRGDIDRAAGEITQHLQQMGQLASSEGELTPELLRQAGRHLEQAYDPTNGGFGQAPKFLHTMDLRLLLRNWRRFGDGYALQMARHTLDRMAMGGLYDHLGGGFARYSTDERWLVPHFEKMLYDNALMVTAYSELYQATNDPACRDVVEETLGWVRREMTSPEGAFYSALDADSDGEEGKFYVWTAKELAALIPDKEDLKLFKKVYGAEDGPNFEGKFSVLRLAEPTDDKLDAKLVGMRAKLFEARERRPRPFLDTKVLTAWNGQMIAGLAKAGQALDDKKAVESAARAARFLLGTMKTKEGRLLRSYAAAPGEKPQARLNGYLDDYAYLVHGLLTLYDVTGEKAWLGEAKALTDTMAKYHGDAKGGGFFYTSSDHEKFFARAKDQYDGAQPAANSVAARNLVRLGRATGDAKYAALAEKTFKALAPTLKASPSSLPLLADALAVWLEKGGPSQTRP
ncbi:MAG: thioredoxin domain-containing protein [Gemmataceae bacterium]